MDELDVLRAFRASLAHADEDARGRVAQRLATPRTTAPAGARRRRVVLVCAALAAMLIVVAISGAANGALSLVGVTDDGGNSMPAVGAGPAAAYLLGDQLHDPSGQVHRLSVAGSAATGFSDAVTAPDGQVLYEAGGQTQQPSLRLFDPAAGTDSLVASDALAPAWRRDGTLAFVTRSPGDRPGSGVVSVRDSPTGATSAWSDDGPYLPLAWAGGSLLVARFGDAGIPTLLAFSGPSASHVLAEGSLVAISPDGTKALIAVGAALDGIPSSPNLRLVDVESGASLGTLDLASVTPAGLETGIVLPGGPGDWVGDTAIFPAPAGLVVLTIDGDAITLAHVVRFTDDAGLRGAEYHEARFAGPSTDHVVVKAIVIHPGGGVMLPSAVVCTLDSEQCTRGAVATNPEEPITLLFNESRPAR